MSGPPINGPMRNKTKRNKRRQIRHMPTEQLEKMVRICQQSIAKYSADLQWAKEELSRREYRPHAPQATDSDD